MLTKNSNIGCYPVCSSETTNNGIVGYTDSPEFIVSEKEPFYVTFGDHTRTLYIQQRSFSVTDNVKVLKPKFFNIKILLYIITYWKKSIKNLGYARHWKLARTSIIHLPTLNGKIAFDYMESYISELEQERISELAAYLKVTVLDNYELTDKERKALTSYPQKTFRTFRIGDLFEKLKTNKLPYKAKDLPSVKNTIYCIPALTAGTANQGLVGFVPRKNATILQNVISVSANALGVAFYQPDEFTVLQDSYAIKARQDDLSYKQYLYVLSPLQKVLSQYNWNNKSGWEKVKNETLSLPTTSDNQIDYDYMETYISAIQKQAIKGVVQWKDKMIATTKQVVNHQK